MPINRIVIVGDGLAAWLCASVCARALSKVAGAVQIVRSAEVVSTMDYSLGAPLNAEASPPAMAAFNRIFEFDENALIHATRGGFTLGTVLSEWVPGTQVFNPFGEVGSVLGPVSFQHLVYRLRDAGQSVKFANYSFAALCAQSARFAKPAAGDHSVLSTLEYGLHVDVAAYAQALKADAIARGVVESKSPYAKPVLNEYGYLDAVVNVDGGRIEGDLFIDCTGACRQLAVQVHDFGFTDWTRWLPCNRISSVMVSTNEAPQPYTQLIAQPSGWVRSISLQGRRSESLYFRHDSIDEINAESRAFTPGYCAAPWQKNCVALGGAATVMDPTSSLSLHLLYSGIQRLINLFPALRHCEQEAIEFNRQSNAEVECARDYAIAHYKLNARVNEPFWDACRAMPVPDSLLHRIEVYRNCGRVVMHDGEVVDRTNWMMLFDASGIRPLQYDVVAQGIPLSLINEHLQAIRQTLLTTVGMLPSYPAYLSQMR